MKNYTLLILMLLVGKFVFSQHSQIAIEEIVFQERFDMTLIGDFRIRYNLEYIYLSQRSFYFFCRIGNRPQRAIPIFAVNTGGTPAAFAYSVIESIPNQLLTPIKTRYFH